MSRPKHGEQSLQQKAAELVSSSPAGMCTADLAAALAVDLRCATVTISQARARFGLVKVQARGVQNGKARWFGDETLARQWLHRELAKLQAHLRALARLKQQQAASTGLRADKALQRATDAARAALAEPPKVRVTPTPTPVHSAHSAPLPAPAHEPRPAGAGNAWTGTHGGMGPLSKPKACAVPKAYAAAQAVVPPEVKHTVHRHKPDPRRIDLFASPLPTVPGWGGGPVIRDGAFDFRRHQHRG